MQSHNDLQMAARHQCYSSACKHKLRQTKYEYKGIHPYTRLLSREGGSQEQACMPVYAHTVWGEQKSPILFLCTTLLAAT